MIMSNVDNYLRLKRAENTRLSITLGLKRFVRWKYDCECETINEMNDLYRQYLTEYKFQDVLDFVIWMRDVQKYKPRSITNYTTTIINYLEFSDVHITKAQRQTLQSAMPRNVTVTQDKPFTREVIQSMLAHTDPLMRAIILLATSSGMRISEVLSLEIDEIEYGHPNKIYMPREKMKQAKSHIYRFSTEAEKALREWLKIRDYKEADGIRRTEKCLRLNKKESQTRVFPLVRTSIYERWGAMLSKAGLDARDRETGRYVYTTHGCRRWFSSTASRHAPHEIVEALIGHDTGLSASYRRYPEDDLDKEYLKIESHLLIFAPSDYSEIKGEMAAALQEQMSTTAQLAASVLTLHEKIEAMELFIKATRPD